MLIAKNISFRYHRSGPPVLNGVDLQLDDGQIGVLLGKNGSGKTTLLKCILGIQRPDSGLLRLDGVDLTAASRRERARLIAYVPQDIRFGDLSVFDSVLMGRVSYFGLRAGMEDYEAVEQLLHRMGLLEFADRNVEELSGGERQKIAIARALAQNPRLLVLDEPTGNLDVANERLILEETARLVQHTGISVLISMHDLNLALAYGDRFFFLKDGTMRFSGGVSCVTSEVLRDIYGINVKIVEIEHQKIILGGK